MNVPSLGPSTQEASDGRTDGWTDGRVAPLPLVPRARAGPFQGCAAPWQLMLSPAALTLTLIGMRTRLPARAPSFAHTRHLGEAASVSRV